MAITWRATVLTALGVVPVLLVPVTLVILAWALLVVLACSVDVALAASPRLLAVQRNVPPSVRLTEQTRSTLTVTNRSGRRLRALVRDAWQPSAGATSNRHPVDLPDGESRRLVTPLRPTRRGDRYADRVTVRSFGPMRLAARQVSLSVPGRLRVLPEFASRRHLPSRLARLRELDGRTAVQVRGAGTEFDSLREYVIGDDVRSIDWRATARRSEVVVRTWRPERDRRVMIVLDTARAASAGDRVDLIAFDRRIRSQVAGANGPRLLPALADALAPVEPALVEADWPGIVGAVQRRLSRRPPTSAYVQKAGSASAPITIFSHQGSDDGVTKASISPDTASTPTRPIATVKRDRPSSERACPRGRPPGSIMLQKIFRPAPPATKTAVSSSRPCGRISWKKMSIPSYRASTPPIAPTLTALLTRM